MLITAVENFVLFSTLFALAAFGVACSAKSLAARGLWRPHPHTLSRIYTATLALPPLGAAWLVGAALLPESWLGPTVFDAAHSAPHNLHLLSEVTAMLEPRLAYLTLSFAVAAALFAAWSSVRGSRRVGGVIERLEMSASVPPPERLALVERVAARHGLDVGLVMSNYQFTFVWGFCRSKLVLSSGLLCALSAEELAGVLEHEAAHHERRDNLVKLILSLCSYASVVFPLSRLILKWRALQVEMICDEVAVANTSTPLEIADALVKLRRQTAGSVISPVTELTASKFMADDVPGFEWRVRRLLSFSDAPPVPAHVVAMSRTPLSQAFVIASAFAATLVGISMYAPLAVHRTAEALIQFIG